MPARSQTYAVAMLLLLIGDHSVAERTQGLTADILTSKTIETQRKVDELYDAGKFERAFFLYRNELVPIGDKYAQYMVGYMYLTGTGIDEDYALASAWYRLAAERGTQEFVAVRDQLARNMTDEQHIEADALYVKLRLQYSDLAVLLASIKRDHTELGKKTGSRFGSGTSPLLVVEGRRGGPGRPGSDYYRHIRDQLKERLLLLKDIGGFDELGSNPDTVNIHELERLVEERLQSEL